MRLVLAIGLAFLLNYVVTEPLWVYQAETDTELSESVKDAAESPQKLNAEKADAETPHESDDDSADAESPQELDAETPDELDAESEDTENAEERADPGVPAKYKIHYKDMEWAVGDGVGGSEFRIAVNVASRKACADLCIRKQKRIRSINGVTYGVLTGSRKKQCYCEYGMKSSNGNKDWVSKRLPKTTDRDFDKRCKKWTKAGWCQTQAWYMKEYCGKSCAYCRDKTRHCRSMKKLCNEKVFKTEVKRMRRQCPETCGTCGLAKDIEALGCWGDAEHRPAIIGKVTEYPSNEVLKKCAARARRERNKVFAVRRNKCFTSKSAFHSYTRYGEQEYCKMGLGGYYKNNVYRFKL